MHKYINVIYINYLLLLFPVIHFILFFLFIKQKQIQDIQTCQFSSIALTAEGSVYTWGKSDYLGQGGVTSHNEDEKNQTIPKLRVNENFGLSDVRSIGCGTDTMFAIKNDGCLYSW